jgi:hypothetical protein
VALVSNLFKGDRALEACLVTDSAHITPGASGEHVSKIQTALLVLDGVSVSPAELAGQRYGTSTAAAVLAFKTRRGIINTSYQKTADNIVGKMTIAAMDKAMLIKEAGPPAPVDPRKGAASV